MTLFRVTIPRDDAWKVVEALGKHGKAHFINMNGQEQTHKLPYASQIANCEETERRLDNLLAMSKTMKIPINKPVNAGAFENKVKDVVREMQTAENLVCGKIDAETLNNDKWVMDQNKNINDIQNGLNSLRDCLKVYEFANTMFGSLLGAGLAPVSVAASNLIDEENNG